MTLSPIQFICQTVKFFFCSVVKTFWIDSQSLKVIAMSAITPSDFAQGAILPLRTTSHASEDRDISASCDTNATGLRILREDELDLTCDTNATGLPILRVAELKLSLC